MRIHADPDPQPCYIISLRLLHLAIYYTVCTVPSTSKSGLLGSYPDPMFTNDAKRIQIIN